MLGDEVLTPDSSRFWPADDVAARAARSRRFDKQYVRDWLISPRPAGTASPRRRRCPADVVAATRARYVEAYERLTGATFS